jgi:GTPase Era involved in 16S rRNA processing/transcriptional regulator with XRE-family HTH domain
LRAASGLTQREFAELLKIKINDENHKSMTQPQLARMEVSTKLPKLETLAQIAWVAGYAIEIHFLLNENHTKPPISIIFGDPVMVDSTENSLYFASIQEELLSERERFLYILHEIRGSLRSRNIDHEVIPNYLSLAKASHDKCIAKSWTLIDIIEEFSKSSLFANNRGVFTSLFDILKDERRENCSYFANTLKLSSDIQKYQDNGSGESAIVRVISNRLDLIEQKAEDDLLKYAKKNSVVRFAVIKLIIPEHSIQEPNNYDDEKFKSYRAVLDNLRQQRQEVLDKLNQFDQLLAYRKSEIRLTKRLVDNYADRLIGQKQSEFIGKSIMEPKMNNLDEVRQQAIAQLEALQKYLNEKGRTKEAEDIFKEVTKMRDNTYQIAFVATFSAGKSTLINAMLGNDILPSMAKPTTGRLTFINDRDGDVAAQVEVSKKGDQRVIILSYRDPQDLQNYLNKYLRNGWIGKAEVYSEEKSLQFDSPVDFVKSAFSPVNETDDIHANQARLTLNKGYSSFSLTDLSQVELSSFINNDAVKELNVHAPVKHLTKQVRLEGIQFVDTPGTNSARHSDHKRITFDFIDKANAVVYVINFTTFPTESDALLLEEIRRQRQYNSRFCDKLFFAVNKIDQDSGNGPTLQDSISSIHRILNNDYGFDLPESRVIGVAALPALLYRMNQDGLLRKQQSKVFNSYAVHFLDDLMNSSPEEFTAAKEAVLRMSNIESLEKVLANYLVNNNKTQELIKDALTRALSFAQAHEQDTQQKISIYRMRLDELKQIADKFSQSLEGVATEKKLIADSLESDTQSLLSEVNNEYAQFINDLKSLVSSIFAGKFKKSKFQGLTKDQIQKLQSCIASVKNLGSVSSEDKGKIDKVIEAYIETFNAAFQSAYPVFESNLKNFCQSRQSEIYTQTYQKAEALLTRINKELNDDINVSAINYSSVNVGMISRPDSISIRDLVSDEIYKFGEQETNDKRNPIRWFVELDPNVLERLTNNNIRETLTKCNEKTSEIVSNQSKDLAMKISTAIDEGINRIEQNLQQAIQDRKNLGENALLEIEKLDADLDLTRQMIAALIELYKFTENLQTNSIN